MIFGQPLFAIQSHSRHFHQNLLLPCLYPSCLQASRPTRPNKGPTSACRSRNSPVKLWNCKPHLESWCRSIRGSFSDPVICFISLYSQNWPAEHRKRTKPRREHVRSLRLLLPTRFGGVATIRLADGYRWFCMCLGSNEPVTPRNFRSCELLAYRTDKKKHFFNLARRLRCFFRCFQIKEMGMMPIVQTFIIFRVIYDKIDL